MFLRTDTVKFLPYLLSADVNSYQRVNYPFDFAIFARKAPGRCPPTWTQRFDPPYRVRKETP